MKAISKKKISAVSTTYELVKKPKPRNQNSGKVSITPDEIKGLTVIDNVKLVVLNLDDTVKVERTYSAPEFTSKLRRHISGKYNLLKY